MSARERRSVIATSSTAAILRAPAQRVQVDARVDALLRRIGA